MNAFFDGFADEMVKLAKDPFGALDTYMKQKNIKAPKALQSQRVKAPPVKRQLSVKPLPKPKPAPPMKMQQVLPGSKVYKRQMALAKKAPKIKPAGQMEREKYRSRSAAISAMQKEQEGGGMTAARAKHWSNIMKGF